MSTSVIFLYVLIFFFIQLLDDSVEECLKSLDLIEVCHVCCKCDERFNSFNCLIRYASISILSSQVDEVLLLNHICLILLAVHGVSLGEGDVLEIVDQH